MPEVTEHPRPDDAAVFVLFVEPLTDGFAWHSRKPALIARTRLSF